MGAVWLFSKDTFQLSSFLSSLFRIHNFNWALFLFLPVFQTREHTKLLFWVPYRDELFPNVLFVSD